MFMSHWFGAWFLLLCLCCLLASSLTIRGCITTNRNSRLTMIALHQRLISRSDWFYNILFKTGCENKRARERERGEEMMFEEDRKWKRHEKQRKEKTRRRFLMIITCECLSLSFSHLIRQTNIKVIKSTACELTPSEFMWIIDEVNIIIIDVTCIELFSFLEVVVIFKHLFASHSLLNSHVMSTFPALDLILSSDGKDR